MDQYRWVVDRVSVGMELPGDASVIHPSLKPLGDGQTWRAGEPIEPNQPGVIMR